MQTRRFGRTGLNVSVIGFGGAPVGYLGTDQTRITDLLNALLDHGVNVIDTAACYPGSEQAIGQAISHRRSEFVLISKCGHKVGSLTGEEFSEKLITFTVDRALGLLKADHLDVMLVHSCDLATLQTGEPLEALVKARTAGKVRFIGYSGDNDAAAWAARQDVVDIIETSISIADQSNIETVLPACRERNLGVIAKRPIANAAWKQTTEQPGIYANYARTYHERIKAMNLTPADLGFKGDAATAWPEIALRFTLSIPGVHTAIIGTTNRAHALQNLDMVSRGPLPEGAMTKLREAFDEAQAATGASWTAQV